MPERLEVLRRGRDRPNKLRVRNRSAEVVDVHVDRSGRARLHPALHAKEQVERQLEWSGRRARPNPPGKRRTVAQPQADT